ncbi:MAG: NAD(P)H-hydrate dehydratase [Candidatus Eisenbacteria bacterium]|nr:NAD(P)H-hydrate dehydratase [Candidatus Eisenbacteria bacterium]
MKLVTADTMRAIDERAIKGMGVPGIDLMERAGLGTARRLERVADLSEGDRVVVVCGKGNNGGDGFVIARDLLTNGMAVRVFLVGTAEDVSGDARVNLDRLDPDEVMELTEPEHLPELVESLSSASAVVDALFGTGFSGAPRGLSGHVIERINAAGRPVVAVDVPSGLNATTGDAEGECVRADWTCTMALPKRGFFLGEGPRVVGELFVVDIGMPDEAIEHVGVDDNVMLPDEAAALLPARSPDSHKGSFGRVVVVAGSAGYTGAAALAATSALRTGSGLVFVACPAGVNDILETKLTEAITRPMPATTDRTLSQHALEPVRELLENANVAAVGPGLSTHPETVAVVRELVRQAVVPCVLDADALNALDVDLIGARTGSAELVLTPHPGEMARLLDTDVASVTSARRETALEAARRTRAVVVLKGSGTIVAEPGGETWLNPTGGVGLASGGTGDVLTGVIASLIGQGLEPFEAAALGAYVHGLAGDIVETRMGSRGMLAGDVLDALPEALLSVEGTRDLTG